ncbi:MAG: arginine N-succinyltransferase [Myxococcales bacterium]|nr:arginine N-succinyltransferase [Myxococcales bacterium]
MVRWEIRAATRDDHDALLALSRHLDSVNLPHDPTEIADLLAHSEASFRGQVRDPRRRQYVFVLCDRETGRAVATSMIIGQLGRKDAPYIYFDVFEEQKYSATLDRHFRHTVLSIGFSYDGPTEIGGLVVHPEYRLTPDRLGMLISYVRFLFIATRRADFRDELLAELMPPLEPDGTSHLWEAVGRHFTGLSYREADRLSKRNKEFIKTLFPDGDIYVSLLPREAQAVVGRVGPQTRGVEKLLRRIGFRYANRVDPFDGGPHFIAPTDEVVLVQRTVRRRIRRGIVAGGVRALVARETASAPWFRAVSATAFVGSDVVAIGDEACRVLEVDDGDEVAVLPLD